MNASVHIEFCEPVSLEIAVRPLLQLGWHFSDDTIYHRVFQLNTYSPEEAKEAPIESWPSIARYLAEKQREGLTVSIVLQWQEADVVGEFCFTHENELLILFFGSQPRIAECSTFTDYGSLAAKIVCPLDAANISILQVSYRDDND